MSGIVLWVASLAVAAAMTLGVSQVGQAAVDAARAQTAADASALAGAAAGPAAASDAAARNGGDLHSILIDDSGASVRATYGSATATARAERHMIPIR